MIDLTPHCYEQLPPTTFFKPSLTWTDLTKARSIIMTATIPTEKMEKSLRIALIAYCTLFFTTLWSQAISAEVCNSTHSMIVRQPLDVTVYEGEDAVFSCTASGFNPDTDHIEWIINPLTYPNIRSNGFDHPTKEMTSSIVFSNIGIEGHTQRCVSKTLNKKKEWTMCTSREAQLAVLYFPKKKDLLCGPTTLQDLHEEETLQIRCDVLQGYPLVNMSWLIEGVNISSPHTFYENNNKIILYDLTVKQEVHNQTIKCLVASETFFPDEQLECQIGPLKVRHQPVIHVHPAYVTLTEEEGATQVRCEGNAYPPIQEFAWSCMPRGVLNGCNRNTNTINLTIDNSFRSNFRSVHETKVFVICTARNSEGASNVTSEITFVSPVQPSKYITKNCTGILLILQQYDVPDSMPNSETSFLCSVIKKGSFSEGSSNFSWYLDDIPFQNSGEESISVEQFSSGSSLLTINNMEKVKTYGKIACEYQVNSCKIRKYLSLEESINIRGGHQPVTTGTDFTPTHSLISISDNHFKDMDLNEGNESESDKHILLISGISIMGGILIAVCLSTTIMLVFHKYSQQKTIHVNANSTPASHNRDCKKDDGFEFDSGREEPTYEDPSIITETLMHQGEFHSVDDSAQYNMNVFRTYSSSDTNTSSSFSSGSALSSGDMEDQSSKETSSFSTDRIKLADDTVHLYVNQEVVEMNSL